MRQDVVSGSKRNIPSEEVHPSGGGHKQLRRSIYKSIYASYIYCNNNNNNKKPKTPRQDACSIYVQYVCPPPAVLPYYCTSQTNVVPLLRSWPVQVRLSANESSSAHQSPPNAFAGLFSGWMATTIYSEYGKGQGGYCFLGTWCANIRPTTMQWQDLWVTCAASGLPAYPTPPTQHVTHGDLRGGGSTPVSVRPAYLKQCIGEESGSLLPRRVLGGSPALIGATA